MQGEERNAWEEAYKRSWDVLADDVSLETLALTSRRPHRKEHVQVQRGIIRYVVVILDLSHYSTITDWRPNNAEVTLKSAKSFVNQFFDQNPLSLLSLSVLKNGIAVPISPFSSNPTQHLSALEVKENRQPNGEPSLQNGLSLASNILSLVPSHGTKQVVVFYSALTSCDPGDIFETLQDLSSQKIQVQIIGLSAQLHICKTIASETGGQYYVAMNDTHLEELVQEFVQPPPLTSTQAVQSDLILMGFPQVKVFSLPTLCVCHEKQITNGHQCPRCQAIVCTLPTECSICGLSLVSSPLLARSYHHLFPVKVFDELSWENVKEDSSSACFGCLNEFNSVNLKSQIPADRYRCGKCKHEFCSECDIFIHDVLHNCPGCLS